MCDTLCAIGPAGALFAKNSDRPPPKSSSSSRYPARPPGGTLRTQYLDMDDAGAFALLGSRPDWLWGFEHGVNEHRVAIGNEKVFTRLNPNKEPPALIGMDIVRLGLERGAQRDEALDVMTALSRARPGRRLRPDHRRVRTSPRSSSATRAAGWVLETSGRTWVAAPVTEPPPSPTA